MAIVKSKQLFGVLSTSITGSLSVSGSISAIIFSGSGTGLTNIPSSAIVGSVASASYALTASFALNGGSGGSGFSITNGSVTASVNLTDSIFLIQSGTFTPFSVTNLGSTTISGSASNLFLIKNINNQSILSVSQSGIVVFATQSAALSETAPNGGIYFTTNNFYVGLD
jgi:hypothetical protein